MNELQEVEAKIKYVLPTTGSVVQLVTKQKPIISTFIKNNFPWSFKVDTQL
jgi:hypothetical protein